MLAAAAAAAVGRIVVVVAGRLVVVVAGRIVVVVAGRIVVVGRTAAAAEGTVAGTVAAARIADLFQYAVAAVVAHTVQTAVEVERIVVVDFVTTVTPRLTSFAAAAAAAGEFDQFEDQQPGLEEWLCGHTELVELVEEGLQLFPDRD